METNILKPTIISIRSKSSKAMGMFTKTIEALKKTNDSALALQNEK